MFAGKSVGFESMCIFNVISKYIYKRKYSLEIHEKEMLQYMKDKAFDACLHFYASHSIPPYNTMRHTGPS